MKFLIKFTILFILLICSSPKKQDIYENILWYQEPASKWIEALPVGNGRLGAMVFGDPNNERIQLNEDSMWPGAADWGNAQGNVDDLKEIRSLLKKGEIKKVDSLIVDRFSYKSIIRSHQTMGDLFIDFKENRNIKNYSRSLNLDKAITYVNYTSNGNNYSQEVFASAVDNVLIVKLETDAINGMHFNLRLNRPDDNGHKTVEVTNPSDTEISMNGMVTQFGGKKMSLPFPIDYGVKFETRLKVKTTSGDIKADNGMLILNNVQQAVIIISGSTSYYNADYVAKNTDIIKNVVGSNYDELKNNHITAYQKYYSRVVFDLGKKELDTLPTNKRLELIKNGFDDPDLATKLFQYGRYLLISSSQPGTNPANLQGIWNEHIQAPWNADYHLNINLQMNYWPAEITNLNEMHMPLFDFADRLLERGKITAKEQYGINRGAVIHHASDLWVPAWMRAEKPYWGSWIHGGGWLAQHYWEHYLFTNDEEFLKQRAYPYLKAIAEFYLDWLVWDEELKKWVSTPETSPENSYRMSNGKSAAISYGAAMGHQIIYDVFKNVLNAATILNIDDEFTKEVKRKKENLFPGVVVSKSQRILEWNEDYDEPEKGHRHMSHLYALHPSNQITEANTIAFEVAKNSIDYRLKHGGAGTGWSRAWMINANARLLDSVAAEENIIKLLQISTANNLFNEHPPFQIDGNFGYTAGVAEMLLQSHEEFLRILPTLPKNWQNGEIIGLKARGNIEVDIKWKEGKLIQLGLLSKKNCKTKIKYQKALVEIQLYPNKKVWLDNALNITKTKKFNN